MTSKVMAVWIFFLCPKQPMIDNLFYRLLYPMICGTISGTVGMYVFQNKFRLFLFSASTTYSTTTSTTATMSFNTCVGCPKNNTIILPKYINLPITHIKSGKWEDCLELCNLIHDQPYYYCNYFNFYTSEFDGDLKNYCNLFSEILDGEDIFTAQRPMKGVVSGALQTYEHTGPGK